MLSRFEQLHDIWTQLEDQEPQIRALAQMLKGIQLRSRIVENEELAKIPQDKEVMFAGDAENIDSQTHLKIVEIEKQTEDEKKQFLQDLGISLANQYYDDPEKLFDDLALVFSQTSPSTHQEFLTNLQPILFSFIRANLNNPKMNQLAEQFSAQGSALDYITEKFSNVWSEQEQVQFFESIDSLSEVLHEAQNLRKDQIAQMKRVVDQTKENQEGTNVDVPTMAALVRQHASKTDREKLTNDLVRDFRSLNVQMFAQLEDHEFHNLNWSRDKTKVHSVNILEITDMFNHLSSSVADDITLSTNQQEQQTIFECYLNIAYECLQQGNFHTMMAISSGLNDSAVHRLQYLKDSLDDHLKAKLSTLVACASAEKNYKNLRQAVEEKRKEGKGVIPFLGMYLTDLTFTDEGNKDKINVNGASYLNVNKMSKYSSVVSNLRSCQKDIRAQSYQPLKYPISAMYQKSHLSKDDRYDRSLTIKPRGQDNPDFEAVHVSKVNLLVDYIKESLDKPKLDALDDDIPVERLLSMVHDSPTVGALSNLNEKASHHKTKFRHKEGQPFSGLDFVNSFRDFASKLEQSKTIDEYLKNYQSLFSLIEIAKQHNKFKTLKSLETALNELPEAFHLKAQEVLFKIMDDAVSRRHEFMDPFAFKDNFNQSNKEVVTFLSDKYPELLPVLNDKVGQLTQGLKRIHIELQTTEKTYVDQLTFFTSDEIRQQIKEVYNNLSEQERALMTPIEDIEKLLDSYKRVADAHRSLLADFKGEEPKNWQEALESALQADAQATQVYTELNTTQWQVPPALLSAFQELAAKNGLSTDQFQAYPIIVIQRTPRYVMLAEEYAKTLSAGDPKKEEATSLVETLKQKAQEINERVRQVEVRLIVQKYQEIESLPEEELHTSSIKIKNLLEQYIFNKKEQGDDKSIQLCQLIENTQFFDVLRRLPAGVKLEVIDISVEYKSTIQDLLTAPTPEE